MTEPEVEEEEEVQIELLSLNEMPTGRLQDVYKLIDDESKSPISLNLDAIIPSGDKGLRILQTICLKMQKSILTLSIRFNTFSPECIDFFIEWILTNDHIKTLYTMGNSIAQDEKKRDALEGAWKKNLKNHRTDNNNFTLIRIREEDMPKEDEEEA